MDIFPILSRRLRLRRFQDDDLSSFVAYRSDPLIARFQSWSSIDYDEARAFIRQQQEAEFGAQGEWFQIAIARRETDALIGDVGVCIKADDRACAEIGFTLARESQGKGFGAEAVRLVLSLVFEQTGVERVEGTTDSRNLSSIELMRRVGMRQERTEQSWFKGSMCSEYTFVMMKRDWITIRAENVEDIPAVRRVNELAFGRPDEAALVDALRAAADTQVSLVAVEEGQIIGHIFFSPVSIEPETTEPDDSGPAAMGLAPMAVLPEHQRRGVGSQLVREGLRECRRLGCNVVVVLGHHEYYPRFGFIPASRKGLRSEYDVPDEVFMVTELEPGALKGKRGLVKYRPEFGKV